LRDVREDLYEAFATYFYEDYSEATELAEELLEDAEELIKKTLKAIIVKDDIEDALDDEDYSEAEDLIDEALELIDEALDEF